MRLSGIIPVTFQEITAKIPYDVIMTSRDVTWSDFRENFRKSYFNVYDDTVKIWSPTDDPNES